MTDSRLSRWARSELRSPRPLLIVLIIVLFVIFASLKPMFLNGPFSISPLITSIAIFTVVGLAQMVVLSIGHMNLAVGQLAGISSLVMGACFQNLKMPLLAGLAVGLIVGAALGTVAGWIIAKTGVNSFIVTLAMSFTLLGLIPTLYSSWSGAGSAFTVQPAGFAELGTGTFADLCFGDVCGSDAVPLLVLPALLCMALVGFFYTNTRVGRETLMTGSNIDAAELSGVPSARRVILAHALSGVLAAAAGFMLASYTGSFTPSIGSEFMLPSFLGPILGGTLLAGGAVSVIGTMLGITLTTVIRNGLLLFQVPVAWLNVLLGTILLAALATDRARLLIAKRRPPKAEESVATLAAELQDAEGNR